MGESTPIKPSNPPPEEDKNLIGGLQKYFASFLEKNDSRYDSPESSDSPKIKLVNDSPPFMDKPHAATQKAAPSISNLFFADQK